MSIDQIKSEILNLFKKDQIKKGGILNPVIVNNYIASAKDKNLLDDAIDDLIMLGLILEVKSGGKTSYQLTRHGDEYIYG
ncbi:MAG: hypothetical protein OEV44_07525 [Spirochaetota bacterium]|nr:hypothetical protein [Spirochaetota bacterium]